MKIYFAYYKRDILLCISNEKKKIKSYLKDIRYLSKDKYTIEEKGFDMDSCENYYPEYIIEEYSKGLYLPRRDIDYIEDYIIKTSPQLETTMELLIDYYNIVKFIPSYNKDLEYIKKSIQNIHQSINEDKKNEKIIKAMTFHSKVFTPLIEEYLNLFRTIEEEKQLNRSYYLNIYKEE